MGELEALVEQHPVRERLRGQYMLALYRSGRQAEALHSYQKARGILVEQLGIEPSRELQQLHGAILRQEAGLQAPDADPPSEDHFAEVLLALFVGGSWQYSAQRSQISLRGSRSVSTTRKPARACHASRSTSR